MELEGELDVTVEDNVVFAYRVTNPGEGTVELSFSNGQRCDVAVRTDAGGSEVWRASRGRQYIMAIGHERLQPEQSRTFRETWPDPPTGSYRATATLAAQEADAPASVAFEVP